MIDYKRIIKSRSLRIKIMQLFNWIPDKQMISIQYRIKTGRKLNWDSPKRFTEKLQLYKIFSKNNVLMAQCVDKYDVRSFIEDRGLSDILIPLVGQGIYDTPEAIDWGNLPDSFVVKDTLGCGGNSVIICPDKNKADKDFILAKCDEWVKTTAKHAGREHVYNGKAHRIIIEQYIDSGYEKHGLIDYKFFCFDGKPAYVYVIANRIIGQKAEIGIYDIDFHILPYTREDELVPSFVAEKPEGYARMLEIASCLSTGFPHVRVDLYNVNGKIYFSEMTFFDGSGYFRYEPDSFDYELGDAFKLPEKADRR